MSPNSVTLGRPWHPFADATVSSAVAFIDCWMDDHIGDRGWDRMSSVDSTGTRVWYEPAAARFVEFGTKGPGAVQSPTRRVLSDADSGALYADAVLCGWVPALGQSRGELRRCACRFALLAIAAIVGTRRARRRMSTSSATRRWPTSRRPRRIPSAVGANCSRGSSTSTWSIHNHAVNGRSTKSFIDEGQWTVVMRATQAGRLRLHRVRPQRREGRGLRALRRAIHRVSRTTSSAS